MTTTVVENRTSVMRAPPALPAPAPPSSPAPSPSSSVALPLHWAFNARTDDEERFSILTLPGGTKFVHDALLAPGTTVEELRRKIDALADNGGRVIVHGCEEGAGAWLSGGRLALTSAARIDLPGYTVPRSVKDLMKRGGKKLAVRALPVDDATDAALAPWIASLRGPGTPQLQYLFRTDFKSSERAFGAFAPSSSTPAGLVTLSRYGDGQWHVCLLLRDPDAPAGTMELLLGSVIATLQAEGASVLNLGENGFDLSAQALRSSWLDVLVLLLIPLFVWLGREKFSVAGLHRFKDKFNPTWEPRYFYSNRRLRLWDLVAIGWQSGIRKLA